MERILPSCTSLTKHRKVLAGTDVARKDDLVFLADDGEAAYHVGCVDAVQAIEEAYRD